MGTDIHHKFQKEDEDGKWHDIDLPRDKYGDYAVPFNINRHYLLFSVLAGVRNGHGFAGVYTHEPLTPIAEKRGLPEGEDDYDFQYGEHSQSWLTSTEILDYFKSEHNMVQFGYISYLTYIVWDGEEAPDCYASYVSGEWVHDASAEFGKSTHDIFKSSLDDSNKGWVRVKWKVSINETLSYFVQKIELLHERYGEVRLVFGFDS